MLVTKMNYKMLLNNLEKFRKNTILSNNDSNKINKNKKNEKNISGQ